MGDLEDFLAENSYVARRKFEKFHSLQREICRTSRELCWEMDGNANAVSALHIFTVNVEQEISLNFQKKLSVKLALLRKLVKMQICSLFM